MSGLITSRVLELAGVAEAFEHRLDRDTGAPIAVAFSGGADSLLTLLAAKAWADRYGRRVLALSIDHRLQPTGADWTRRCAAVAARLGVDFTALAWTGPKPGAGLPAAARDARHRLLAEAARAAGASVIVLGHTGSDIAESEVMRAEGANLGRLRQWSPSPVWPQGRGVFCLRPLLDLTRSQVRTWLAAGGWDWIDDPANEDPRYGRSRARKVLAGAERVSERGMEPVMTQAARVRFGVDGSACAPRQADIGPELLRITLLCVSGGQVPARGPKVAALAARLAGTETFTATLGGCRISADPSVVVIARDAGEARRGRIPSLALIAGERVVWDGRFEITADIEGAEVRVLQGLARRLPTAERSRLAALPAAARPALPAIMVNGAETVTCPILAERPQVRAGALAAGRYLAACDLIAHERAAISLAHGEFIFDVLSWTRETEKGRPE